jgi:hypothetical protein
MEQDPRDRDGEQDGVYGDEILIKIPEKEECREINPVQDRVEIVFALPAAGKFLMSRVYPAITLHARTAVHRW